MGEIWPLAAQKPLNRSYPKCVRVIASRISTTMQNFMHIGLGVRFCACAIICTLLSSLFFHFLDLVLPLAYSQDAHTDFHAKYAKRCGSAQGCAFWGSWNQYLKFQPLLPPKLTILGPTFDSVFFRPKCTAQEITSLNRRPSPIKVVYWICKSGSQIPKM